MQYVSLSLCHLTARQAREVTLDWRIHEICILKHLYISIFVHQTLSPFELMYNFSIKRATHQIFGTHAGSPRSSLRFSDSRCHSSTPFFSWCTQNTRCSGRCSSSGSPSPCSPPQPAEKVPHRRRLNIHKRRTRGAPSSIRALP